MSKITYKEKFKQFQDLLIQAFCTYYVWKVLQTEDNNVVYQRGGIFWITVLSTLQSEWFISIARIYEKSKYSKNGVVISVFALIDDHPSTARAAEAREFLDKNKKLIEIIKDLRDNKYAHNNADYLLNPKDSKDKFKIKYSELEQIFEFTDKLLGILHPEDSHGYSLSHLKDQISSSTLDVVAGLQYFYSERDKQMLRFKNRECDSPKFPPDR